MENYYMQPTQVIFVEEASLLEDGPKEAYWGTGIAYKNVVICNCCGGVIPIEEIAYIFEFEDWCDYGRDDMINCLGASLKNHIQEGIDEAYDWLEEDRP